jgi:hypothetical protein
MRSLHNVHLIGHNLHFVSDALYEQPAYYALNGLWGYEQGYVYSEGTAHIPAGVLRIKMNERYGLPLPEALPDSLVELQLGAYYSWPLPPKLPPGLQKLILGTSFVHFITLPPQLQHFEICSLGIFNQPLQLPPTLLVLRLDNCVYDHSLDLPDGLLELRIGRCNQNLQLPPSLQIFRAEFLLHNVHIPTNVRVLRITAMLSCDPGQAILRRMKYGRWLWHDGGSTEGSVSPSEMMSYLRWKNGTGRYKEM